MVSPGASIRVAVSIPTRYIRTRDVYSKTIEVETNAPDTPVISLTMKLRVKEVLAVSPMQIDFRDVKPGSTYRRAITVTNKGTGPMTLEKITLYPDTVLSLSHKDGRRLEGPQKLESGQTLSLELSFTPSPRSTRFFGTVQIVTSLEDLRAKIIQVRASMGNK
jgi:hypothetical protein